MAKYLTYLLTPWSRVLLQKLTGSAASQEIPRIFGTRRFITVLTSARHLSLASANSIQSSQPPPTIHLNIILPSASGPPQWSLSLRFPHQNPVHTSPLPHTRHMPRPSHFSRFMAKHLLGFIYVIVFKRPDFHYVFAHCRLSIKENILCIKGICLWPHHCCNEIANGETLVCSQWRIYDRLLNGTWPSLLCETKKDGSLLGKIR